MDIGHWVRAARQSARLTQDQLGEMLGCGKANVSAWENGRHRPRPDQVRRIAEIASRPYAEVLEILDLTPHESEGVESIRSGDSEQSSRRSVVKVATLAHSESLRPGEMWLPMHEGVYPMMGDGGESNGTEVVTLVRVAEETLRRRLAASAYSGLRNLRLVTARGVSMAPTFQPGDVLIVDSAVNDVREDGIYVFSREDELFVKRLQRSVDGSLMVISDNPLHAQDRIERERLGAYRIHGRVLSSWNFHVHS